MSRFAQYFCNSDAAYSSQFKLLTSSARKKNKNKKKKKKRKKKGEIKCGLQVRFHFKFAFKCKYTDTTCSKCFCLRDNRRFAFDLSLAYDKEHCELCLWFLQLVLVKLHILKNCPHYRFL